MVSDVFVFRGNPPRNKGPGWEATPQLLVPQHPSAQSVRLPDAWLWTKRGQRPHRKMWEDYPPRVAAMPRLPNNPSKRPGKKLLLRGLFAARPTMMSETTSGCLRGSLCSNSHTLPRWSVILEESSPIRFFVSCGDRSSSRWD